MTSGNPRALAALCALAAACAHQQLPSLRATQLIVEKTPRGVRSFVRAKVAGESIRLLVDTGAKRSVLPASFAQKHRLANASDAFVEHGIDANGNLLSMQLLKDVPVQFDGEAGAGRLDFLMNPAEQFSDGILAPQDLLRSGGALVIDLEHKELRYEPEAEAIKRPGLAEIEFSRCLKEGFFERSHRFVPTVINGVQTPMMLDTGASVTLLSRNNPALPSMARIAGDRGTMTGMTSVGQGLVVNGVPLIFAKTSYELSVSVSPTSMMCGGGLLGADVLAHCTIVWGYSSLWADCRPAAPPPAPAPSPSAR